MSGRKTTKIAGTNETLISYELDPEKLDPDDVAKLLYHQKRVIRTLTATLKAEALPYVLDRGTRGEVERVELAIQIGEKNS